MKYWLTFLWVEVPYFTLWFDDWLLFVWCFVFKSQKLHSLFLAYKKVPKEIFEKKRAVWLKWIPSESSAIHSTMSNTVFQIVHLLLLDQIEVIDFLLVLSVLQLICSADKMIFSLCSVSMPTFIFDMIGWYCDYSYFFEWISVGHSNSKGWCGKYFYPLSTFYLLRNYK